MKYSDTTVIIPTLNEAKNVQPLVSCLQKQYPKIKILIADDGSRDQTREIAEKAGALVLDRTNQKTKGITAAVVDALKQTHTKNLIVMDADFQHPPEKIRKIIDRLKVFPLVIAARSSLPKKWGLLRKLQSQTANFLCCLRLRKKIKDPVSGFFGIQTQLFKKTNKKNFEMKCFKILFNILKNQKNAKIGYVHYNFNLRKSGQSKISKKHIYYFLKNLIK